MVSCWDVVKDHSFKGLGFSFWGLVFRVLLLKVIHTRLGVP